MARMQNPQRIRRSCMSYAKWELFTIASLVIKTQKNKNLTLTDQK